MVVRFIGKKNISGVSKKTGEQYSFSIATLTSDFSMRDKDNGAIGQDVHSCTIPDRLNDIFSKENIGKEMDVDFYFTPKGENIGYAALVK